MVQLSGTNSTSRLTKIDENVVFAVLLCILFEIQDDDRMTFQHSSELQRISNGAALRDNPDLFLPTIKRKEVLRSSFVQISQQYICGRDQTWKGIFSRWFIQHYKTPYRVVLKAREILWFFLHKLAQLEL